MRKIMTVYKVCTNLSNLKHVYSELCSLGFYSLFNTLYFRADITKAIYRFNAYDFT